MSGHSKWSKVKHQKAVTDAVKGKAFTKLAAAIILSVREGGGPDPATNFKLRLAIDKARASNMPKENIERAIEKGSNTGKEGGMEAHVYEGFAPGGVGVIIEALTDNKQRTVSEIKNMLETRGGSLATTGAVSHSFTRMGYIEVKKNGASSDDLFEKIINAGAADMEENGDIIEVYTEAGDLHKVKESLEKESVVTGESELIYRPSMFIPITDPATSKKIEELLTSLEDHNDVQKVYANCEIV